jgi:hypothetical protein
MVWTGKELVVWGGAKASRRRCTTEPRTRHRSNSLARGDPCLVAVCFSISCRAERAWKPSSAACREEFLVEIELQVPHFVVEAVAALQVIAKFRVGGMR